MTDIFANDVGIAGTAVCSLDIGDSVNVNDGCCFAFKYDPNFVRY